LQTNYNAAAPAGMKFPVRRSEAFSKIITDHEIFVAQLSVPGKI
jgi:hypothetical protein